MEKIELEEDDNHIIFPLQSGIPKSFVVQAKVDLEYVICPICFNIIWQPISCSQEKCYSSFCSVCINTWLQESDSDDNNNSDQDEPEEVDLEVMEFS